MILEVCWDGLWTLSFGLSHLHGHGSWLVCEVALSVWTSSVEIIGTGHTNFLVKGGITVGLPLRATSHMSQDS